VEDETLDCGITGADWIEENSSHVTSLAELLYAKQTSNKVAGFLAVPEASSIKSVKDCKAKKLPLKLSMSPKNI